MDPPEDRNPFAVRRDELIGPIVTSLARRLKRTLQDSQNELLDSLRSKGSHWSIELLPDEKEHVDGYATAALPALEQAVGSRRRLRRRRQRPRGPAPTCWSGSPTTWPRRWSVRSGAGSRTQSRDWPMPTKAVVAEHVGSAFREWKGERIERLAGDHVVAAFSAGTDRGRR